MKYLFTIILAIYTCSTFAQKTQLKCEAISDNYEIELYKINSKAEWQAYKPDYPVYTVDSLNFEIIQKTLLLMASRSNEIDQLKTNINNYKHLVNENDTLIALQEKRVKLYQSSYNQLAEVNSQLSKQVDQMYSMSLKENKKSKLNGTMFGLVAGLVTGIALNAIIN